MAERRKARLNKFMRLGEVGCIFPDAAKIAEHTDGLVGENGKRIVFSSLRV